MKTLLMLGIVAIVFLGGCIGGQPNQATLTTPQLVPPTFVDPLEGTLHSSQTRDIRELTAANCQHLAGKTVQYNGTVLFEECGKNGLGGGPGTGPYYCFYGIQDSDNCVVYVKSRILVRDEAVFNQFAINTSVVVNGTIRSYDLSGPYFVIGEVWPRAGTPGSS